LIEVAGAVIEKAYYDQDYDPDNPEPPVCFAFDTDPDNLAPVPEDVADLQNDKKPIPRSIEPFLEMPDAPPAARKLIADATTKYDNVWDRFAASLYYVAGDPNSAFASRATTASICRSGTAV